jgi:hypothetical protein
MYVYTHEYYLNYPHNGINVENVLVLYLSSVSKFDILLNNNNNNISNNNKIYYYYYINSFISCILCKPLVLLSMTNGQLLIVFCAAKFEL